MLVRTIDALGHFKRGYSTVCRDGGCWVGEVQASTTSHHARPIRVLSYSNSGRSTHSVSNWIVRNLALRGQLIKRLLSYVCQEQRPQIPRVSYHAVQINRIASILITVQKVTRTSSLCSACNFTGKWITLSIVWSSNSFMLNLDTMFAQKKAMTESKQKVISLKQLYCVHTNLCKRRNSITPISNITISRLSHLTVQSDLLLHQFHVSVVHRWKSSRFGVFQVTDSMLNTFNTSITKNGSGLH